MSSVVMARKMGFRQSLTARWVFRSSAIRVSARKPSMPWRRMQRARRSLNGLRAMTVFLTIRTPKIILPPRIRRPRLKLRFGRVLRAVPLPAGYLGVMLVPNGRILAISLSASRHAWHREAFQRGPGAFRGLARSWARRGACSDRSERCGQVHHDQNLDRLLHQRCRRDLV